MSMDAFSLLDDEKQCYSRTDLTLHEMYKTRLVRVDQRPRTRQDPLQRLIHKLLRQFRYLRILQSSQENAESASPVTMANRRQSYQNTALITDVVSRIIVAVVAAIFLTVPLAALSHEPRKSVQIGVISICIVIFAGLVSMTLRASNLEMLVVSAAYAAIISVFVSNSPVQA